MKAVWSYNTTPYNLYWIVMQGQTDAGELQMGMVEQYQNNGQGGWQETRPGKMETQVMSPAVQSWLCILGWG